MTEIENSNDRAKQLLQSFRQFKRLRLKIDSTEGLRQSELMVLMCIHQEAELNQGLKVSQLSKLMKVSAPTVTQILNVLNTRGFIRRVSDAQDRRSIRVVLTSQGQQVVQQATDELYKIFDELVNHLGEEKSAVLVDILEEVFDHLIKK